MPDATIDDIDMDFVKNYTDKIDYGKSPLEYLKENRGFIKKRWRDSNQYRCNFVIWKESSKISFLVLGSVLYVMREQKKKIWNRNECYKGCYL